MSIANSILSKSTVKKEEFRIPEWSEEPFFLHELNAGQRDQYGYDASKNPSEFARGFSIRIIIDTLFDKDGNKVFDESHAKELSTQSGTLLSKVASASQSLSGLSEDSVEEAEKN